MSARGLNLPGRETNPLGAYDTPLGLCRAVVERLDAHPDMGPGRRILEPSVGSGNWIRALQEDPARWARLEVEAMDLDPLAPGLDLAHLAGCAVTSPSSANFDADADAWARAELERQGVPAYRQDVAAAGFLVTAPQRRPDLILGNPPYSVTAPEIPCPDCGATGEIPGSREGSTRKCPACNRWPAGKRPKGLAEGHQPERLIQVADLHVQRALGLTARHLVLVLRLPFLGGQERFRDLWSLGGLRAVWTVVGRPSFAHGGTDSVETAVFWWDREWTRPTFEGGWLTWSADV